MSAFCKTCNTAQRQSPRRGTHAQFHHGGRRENEARVRHWRKQRDRPRHMQVRWWLFCITAIMHMISAILDMVGRAIEVVFALHERDAVH